MYWEEFFTFLRSRVLQVTITIWFSWNMASWFMTQLRHLFCFTLNSECSLSRVTLINVCCIIYQRRNINGTCPLIHSKSQCCKQLEYFILMYIFFYEIYGAWKFTKHKASHMNKNVAIFKILVYAWDNRDWRAHTKHIWLNISLTSYDTFFDYGSNSVLWSL